MSVQRHSLTVVPPKRGLLGGGSAGTLVCSCGWTHRYIAAGDVRRLWVAHLAGEL